jgi:hypothetical protein
LSILYQEIFVEKVDAMDDNKEIDLSYKLKLIRDIRDAYSKVKLTELHYNILMNKISEINK